MDKDVADFKFEEWRNRSASQLPFRTRVRRAIDSLVLKDKDLRSRLANAYFWLLDLGDADVPESLRSEYANVFSYFDRRLGPESRYSGHEVLVELIAQMKLRTALRLAEQLLRLYEMTVIQESDAKN